MFGIIKRILQGVALCVLVALGYFAWSVYQASKESPGEPLQVVVATWMRDHSLGPVVAKLEDFYYTHINTAAVGGAPVVSAQIENDGSDVVTTATPRPSLIPIPPESTAIPDSSPVPQATPDFSFAPIPKPTTQALPLDGVVAHLDPPSALVSPASAPEPMEGIWQPVGNYVAGSPAIYVTRIRTDNIHTSYYATAMWIDTKLTTTMFVPGFEEPKGGPNQFGGSLPAELVPLLLANTNGAFRLEDARGGYVYDGTVVKPLETHRASAVFFRDGHLEIGRWGRDFQMNSEILAVRQNLDLIVDRGKSLVNNPAYSTAWGATTDKENLAWRAGIGQRTDGSIVYVIGQALSAQSLADTLVAAGAQRAMVLDMNQYWSAGFYFSHTRGGAAICHRLDPDIGGPCDRFLHSYKRDSFQFLAAYPMGRRV